MSANIISAAPLSAAAEAISNVRASLHRQDSAISKCDSALERFKKAISAPVPSGKEVTDNLKKELATVKTELDWSKAKMQKYIATADADRKKTQKLHDAVMSSYEARAWETEKFYDAMVRKLEAEAWNREKHHAVAMADLKANHMEAMEKCQTKVAALEEELEKKSETALEANKTAVVAHQHRAQAQNALDEAQMTIAHLYSHNHQLGAERDSTKKTHDVMSETLRAIRHEVVAAQAEASVIGEDLAKEKKSTLAISAELDQAKMKISELTCQLNVANIELNAYKNVKPVDVDEVIGIAEASIKATSEASPSSPATITPPRQKAVPPHITLRREREAAAREAHAAATKSPQAGGSTTKPVSANAAAWANAALHIRADDFEACRAREAKAEAVKDLPPVEIKEVYGPRLMKALREEEEKKKKATAKADGTQTTKDSKTPVTALEPIKASEAPVTSPSPKRDMSPKVVQQHDGSWALICPIPDSPQALKIEALQKQLGETQTALKAKDAEIKRIIEAKKFDDKAQALKYNRALEELKAVRALLSTKSEEISTIRDQLASAIDNLAKKDAMVASLKTIYKTTKTELEATKASLLETQNSLSASEKKRSAYDIEISNLKKLCKVSPCDKTPACSCAMHMNRALSIARAAENAASKKIDELHLKCVESWSILHDFEQDFRPQGSTPEVTEEESESSSDGSEDSVVLVGTDPVPQ